MQKIVVIDCNSGNIRSCAKAVEAAVLLSGEAAEVSVATTAREVAKADRIILPGQGAFRTCMKSLQAMPDMIDTLESCIIGRARPFFGICVGMQLLADKGHEHETTDGLGWLGGDVVPLQVPADYKIPHMGWNKVAMRGSHALLPDDINEAHVYFVHSYHLQPKRSDDLLLTCDYGGAVTAMVARDNLAGTQFHPEKSGEMGLSLLKKFVEWKP